MQPFQQDGTEYCQLIFADYLDDHNNNLADDTRLDATDPQMNESEWCYEYRYRGVGGEVGVGVGGVVGGIGIVVGGIVVGGIGSVVGGGGGVVGGGVGSVVGSVVGGGSVVGRVGGGGGYW